MNPNRPFERDLEDWLQAEAPTVAPAGLHAAVIDRAHSLRQRPGWATSVPARWLGRNRGITLFAAAALLLVGSALAAGTGLVPHYLNQLGIGDPPLPTTPDAWSRSRSEPPPLHVDGITAAGSVLVAVGADDATHEQAAIATSSDGRTWSRVPGEELGPGVVYDVTVGGPGLVAVGYGGGLYGAVWTSRDGLTWSRATHSPVFERSTITAVSAGGPGLVAVGGSRAWFSSDGLTWAPASAPPAPPGVAVRMADIAAAGDHLVAVGWTTMDAESYEAVMWTSADGVTWTSVPLDAGVFPHGSEFRSVTGGPQGFVAIVDSGSGPDTMRISADGQRWSRVNSDEEPFRSTQPDQEAVEVSSVTAGSGGYVAVGADGPCNGVGDCVSAEVAVWTSQDGRSWVRVPTGPVFRSSAPANPDRQTSPYNVFPWGSGFLVTGEYEGERAVWVSR